METEPDKGKPTITELVDSFLSEQRALADLDDGMTFVAAVRAFLSVSDWIGPEHMPAVVTLTKLASQLDYDLTAALSAQFGVAFRDLRAQAPRPTEPDDPIEAALSARNANTEEAHS